MKTPFTKIIASVLASAYFSVNVLGAGAPESAFWSERRRGAVRASPTDAFSLERSPLSPPVARRLPREFAETHRGLLAALSPVFGTVRKISLPAGPPRGVVLHIQDVHQNAEAQRRIGGLIGALTARGLVDLVALEGRADPVDLRPFQRFPERDVVRRVADYLLRVNKISGPVHALMTAPGGPPVIGVDDRAHYARNVDAYRRAAPRLADDRRRLAVARAAWARRCDGVFSPALRALDEAVERHHAGGLSLGAYAEQLSAHAGPDLSRFLQARRLEKSLNFSDVEKERGAVLHRLVPRLDPTALHRLTRDSLDFRAGALSHGAFSQSLRTFCEKFGVSLAGFPALDAYLRYVQLSDGVDAGELQRDLDRAEDEAYARLAATPAQKRLVAEGRRLRLEAKLLDFALTPEDWARYSSTAQPGRYPACEDFYREARWRDDAMAAHLLSAAGPGVTVLVTGGFHGDALDRRLARAGMAVLSFTPRLDTIDTAQGAAALSVFTQEKTPLDRLFSGRTLFLAPDPAAGLPQAVLLVAALARRWDSFLDCFGRVFPRGLPAVEWRGPGAVEIHAFGQWLKVLLNPKGEIQDFKIAEGKGRFPWMEVFYTKLGPVLSDVAAAFIETTFVWERIPALWTWLTGAPLPFYAPALIYLALHVPAAPRRGLGGKLWWALSGGRFWIALLTTHFMFFDVSGDGFGLAVLVHAALNLIDDADSATGGSRARWRLGRLLLSSRTEWEVRSYIHALETGKIRFDPVQRGSEVAKERDYGAGFGVVYNAAIELLRARFGRRYGVSNSLDAWSINAALALRDVLDDYRARRFFRNDHYSEAMRSESDRRLEAIRTFLAKGKYPGVRGILVFGSTMEGRAIPKVTGLDFALILEDTASGRAFNEDEFLAAVGCPPGRRLGHFILPPVSAKPLERHPFWDHFFPHRNNRFPLFKDPAHLQSWQVVSLDRKTEESLNQEILHRLRELDPRLKRRPQTAQTALDKTYFTVEQEWELRSYIAGLEQQVFDFNPLETGHHMTMSQAFSPLFNVIYQAAVERFGQVKTTADAPTGDPQENVIRQKVLAISIFKEILHELTAKGAFHKDHESGCEALMAYYTLNVLKSMRTFLEKHRENRSHGLMIFGDVAAGRTVVDSTTVQDQTIRYASVLRYAVMGGDDENWPVQDFLRHMQENIPFLKIERISQTEIAARMAREEWGMMAWDGQGKFVFTKNQDGFNGFKKAGRFSIPEKLARFFRNGGLWPFFWTRYQGFENRLSRLFPRHPGLARLGGRVLAPVAVEGFFDLAVVGGFYLYALLGGAPFVLSPPLLTVLLVYRVVWQALHGVDEGGFVSPPEAKEVWRGATARVNAVTAVVLLSLFFMDLTGGALLAALGSGLLLPHALQNLPLVSLENYWESLRFRFQAARAAWNTVSDRAWSAPVVFFGGESKSDEANWLAGALTERRVPYQAKTSGAAARLLSWYSRGAVFFPGEDSKNLLLSLLADVRNKRISPRPLVLYDRGYWTSLVTEQDQPFVTLVDSPNEALEALGMDFVVGDEKGLENTAALREIRDQLMGHGTRNPGDLRPRAFGTLKYGQWLRSPGREGRKATDFFRQIMLRDRAGEVLVFSALFKPLMDLANLLPKNSSLWRHIKTLNDQRVALSMEQNTRALFALFYQVSHLVESLQLLFPEDSSGKKHKRNQDSGRDGAEGLAGILSSRNPSLGLEAGAEPPPERASTPLVPASNADQGFGDFDKTIRAINSAT